MLSKFLYAQWLFPVKNDWVHQVKEDLVDLKISLSLEQLKLKSKTSFKKIVKIRMKEFTLEYLNEQKEKHSKMENLLYIKLKLQSYLKNPEISVQAAKNLFRWRTRAAEFKTNYKGKHQSLVCPFCQDQPDSQAHSMHCRVICQHVNIEGDYSDIFDEDIPANISNTLLKIFNYRKDSL